MNTSSRRGAGIQKQIIKPMIKLCHQIINKVNFFVSRLKLDRREQQITGRPKVMKLAEAITYGLAQRISNIATKKQAWKTLEAPGSYQTYVRVVNRCGQYVAVILAIILKQNCLHAHPMKITDATDLPACLNKNAKHHKTMSILSSWGKTGKGWFYGIKLHLTTDIQRRVLALTFSSGNVHDGSVFQRLNRDLSGIFLADAGYTGEELAREFYRETGGILIARPRKNMKKIATAWQHWLYGFRMRIEWNFRSLKLFYGIVTSLPRSIDGYLSHYIYSLVGYLLA